MPTPTPILAPMPSSSWTTGADDLGDCEVNCVVEAVCVAFWAGVVAGEVVVEPLLSVWTVAELDGADSDTKMPTVTFDC